VEETQKKAKRPFGLRLPRVLRPGTDDTDDQPRLMKTKKTKKKTNNNNQKTSKSKKRSNKGLVEWTDRLERERAALGLDHSKSRSEDSIFFASSEPRRPPDARRTQSDALAALLSPRWQRPSEAVDEASGTRSR
jgi:hypothetical protein